MIVVMYHADCSDGFGAAWAAYRRYGDKARYLPVKHYSQPPKTSNTDEVYLLDFCYPVPEMKKLLDSSKSVTVIDHHASAREKLSGFKHDNLTTAWDMKRSGAVMAWDYFHPRAKIPSILQYIQDQDLWTWKMPLAKQIMAYVNCQPHDMDVWDNLVDNVTFDEMVKAGEQLLLQEKKHVDMICQHWSYKTVGGRIFPAVNTAVLGSVAGAQLVKMTGEPMAGTYFENGDGDTVWSVRGDGTFDCIEFVTQFGGGGHHDAAGFKVKGTK